MLRELQAVVVGDGFDTVILQGSDDAAAGFLAGFAIQLDELAVAGFALVEAQDVSCAARAFDQVRFPIPVAGQPRHHRRTLRNVPAIGDFHPACLVPVTVTPVSVDPQIQMQLSSCLPVLTKMSIDRAGAHLLASQGQTAADLLGTMLRLQSHDDLIRQTLGNHRLAGALGFPSLESLGLGLFGSVAPLPGVPFELLADGSLAESDRSRDLGLRLIVFLHSRAFASG